MIRFALVFLVSTAHFFTLSFGLGQEFAVVTELQELLNLLSSDDVRDDAEITDEQYAELKVLLRESSRIRNKLQQEGPKASTHVEKSRIADAYKRAAAHLREQLGQILLPQQVERLKQIENQFEVRPPADTSFGVLKLAEQLKLSKSQVARIKEITLKNERRFEEKIASVRREFVAERTKLRKNLLTKLTDEQAKKFQLICGAEYLERFWVKYWFTQDDMKRTGLKDTINSNSEPWRRKTRDSSSR